MRFYPLILGFFWWQCWSSSKRGGRGTSVFPHKTSHWNVPLYSFADILYEIETSRCTLKSPAEVCLLLILFYQWWYKVHFSKQHYFKEKKNVLQNLVSKNFFRISYLLVWESARCLLSPSLEWKQGNKWAAAAAAVWDLPSPALWLLEKEGLTLACLELVNDLIQTYWQCSTSSSISFEWARLPVLSFLQWQLEEEGEVVVEKALRRHFVSRAKWHLEIWGNDQMLCNV